MLVLASGPMIRRPFKILVLSFGMISLCLFGRLFAARLLDREVANPLSSTSLKPLTFLDSFVTLARVGFALAVRPLDASLRRGGSDPRRGRTPLPRSILMMKTYRLEMPECVGELQGASR